MKVLSNISSTSPASYAGKFLNNMEIIRQKLKYCGQNIDKHNFLFVARKHEIIFMKVGMLLLEETGHVWSCLYVQHPLLAKQDPSLAIFLVHKKNIPCYCALLF